LLSCRAVFGVSWVVVVVVEKVTVTVEKETTERRNDGMRRVGEATVVVRQVWSWCAVAGLVWSGHRRKVRRGRRCQRGKGDGERTRPTSSITAGTSERNEEEMAKRGAQRRGSRGSKEVGRRFRCHQTIKTGPRATGTSIGSVRTKRSAQTHRRRRRGRRCR
jgi:hypothetical protein